MAPLPSRVVTAPAPSSVPAPVAEIRSFETTSPQPVLPLVAAPVPVLPERPTPHQIDVQMGLFKGAAGAGDIAKPAIKVATGGFDSSGNIPEKLSRGALASSGAFGDVGAIQPARPATSRISSTQFDAASVTAAPRRAASRAEVSEPIQILARPKAAYTEEARRLGIQGEVVVEVLFRATSQICVLRVVRGLGHGLDASALQAVSEIRFRPAAEGGRPVDSVATVKIEFQLAD